MWKNNLISIASHIFMCILSALLFSSFYKGLPSTIVSIIISFATYFVIGYFIIGNTQEVFDEKEKNLLSVSSVSIICIIIWLVCLFLDNGSLMSGFIWLLSYFANLSFLYIAFLLQNIITGNNDNFSPPLLLLISIFPSLLIWLGIEIKSLQNKKSHFLSKRL